MHVAVILENGATGEQARVAEASGDTPEELTEQLTLVLIALAGEVNYAL